MNRRTLMAIVWGCAILSGVAAPAVAESEGGPDRTLSPYFFVENGDESVDRFPLKETRVAVDISGVIAHVTVLQRYVNGGMRPINARYIFPASTRAAVHGMTMTIGDQVIAARIQERESARKTFDDAKNAGKSASLLEQQRPNVFSMNVANILPGDRVDIELRYTELLVPTDGTYSFVYPAVVGPRYSTLPAAGAAETDRWLQNPYLKQDRTDPTRFTLEVMLAAGMALQEVVCTTHQTDTRWQNAHTAGISLANGETGGGDRDFILNYRLAGREIQSGLMLYPGDPENFFLLMVEPPERVLPEQVPPREYIFVVDVSGSMHGFPLNTAKTLLRDLIGNLRPTDRFNVILFAGSARVMAPVSVAATTANIDAAIRVLDGERGGGGTELHAALEKGLDLPMAEGVSRSLMVVTDGYIAAEKAVFQLIRSRLDRANVFAFGIGSSVNRYLIEGMAKAGLGEPFVVTRPEAAPAAARAFRQYVASPVLTDIAVRFDGFDAYDVAPAAVPDLFAGRPVIVYGKWRGKPRGTVTVSGAGGTGRFSRDFNVAEFTPLPAHRALAYLWARKRIADLSDFAFGTPDPEQQKEIVSLGLTHNLLTAFTSFVAVHDIVRNPDTPAQAVDQPLPLPRHVSHLAVGGGMASVPEPELPLMGIAVVVLLIIGGAFRNRGGSGDRRPRKRRRS